MQASHAEEKFSQFTSQANVVSSKSQVSDKMEDIDDDQPKRKRKRKADRLSARQRDEEN